MIDKILVEEKINLITRDLERLKIFSSSTFDEIAGDYIKYGAVKNFLMEIIGRAIDINQHLISELPKLEDNIPKSYSETFLYIGNINILPKEFAKKIAQSAGFRNAIVHGYNNLDKFIVYKTIGDAIRQYSDYCRYVLKFLQTI
jgi:uncharacterized protein YutE (UPF0331/DUF86 family)